MFPLIMHHTEENQNQDKTIFIQETISGINLTQEEFSNRRLIGSTVQSFKMQDGRCRYLRARDTRFHNFSIDHVLCDQGYYQDCSWAGLEVRNSFLTGSHFSGCTFETTKGSLSSFGLSVFSDCKLMGSRFREVSMSGTWWQGCRFEEEDYFFVRFPSSVFMETTFAGCRLQKAIFRTATFIRCTFERCTLNESVFHKARFIDTKWIDTDIHQAANLERVRYD
ncbi:MAG: pentapeptide repeat-containing protein [Candidatus Brocadia sp. BROELEC01]|nr:pentapeptide repeat-containing protein [Candidatus Brocadia sapporoensis]QQR65539.1 MAG: pentapeptide repeat-containing protein [Candidatus Brocadia sp.]RZV57261.1 MAG: pentapeptide repeat-containing protein [Candidatus Brocadia sp. BROELEC01]